MAQKELKEAFVANLNGTRLEEVVLGSFLSPLCFIIRGFLLILYYQTRGTVVLPLPPFSHMLLDVCVLVFPLVLSCTVLSSILHQVILSLIFLSAGLFYWIYVNTDRSVQKPASSFLQTPVQCDQVPFVTLFRVFVNVKTAISILAVDFPIFPRRYAKTETYGTGVMDFGVGAFVFANALVCPEARRKNVSGSRMGHVAKQIVSVWPLLALGLARLVSVKLADYQEHVTEYGVHWNFFFTLAVVRIVASALLTVLPSRLLWVFALLFSGLYQFILETSELKTFIIHNNEREKDFLHANKEGIFSIVGYVAIYLIGVQFGLFVMQPKSHVKDWLKMLVNLFFSSLILYGVLFACQTFVEPVSRRLANLPFVIWSVGQSLLFMSCLCVADMVLLFSKKSSGCPFIPSSLSLCTKKDENVETSGLERLCIIKAVHRNQLLFFLLANLMTGLTNMLVDTLSSDSFFSVSVLLLYMFVNCILVHVLHILGITVKFW
ncbi:Phosphatidylinositol-glycan biosynthesis class W protein [Oryzias melastigma]|uniref:Phosphatidylinositol-glycan biosynthesis class W protein n=1 Tax=Oryzias melastigma TaxID=30732 RepID=A0A834FQE0_ORYME|nr:Phosphatidylinositol-glycan biosynthesis class W protein [Oryzias melastigma]